MKPIEDTIETKDLYLSSLWYAKGIPLLNVRRKESQCWFVFANKTACEAMQKGYFGKEETVIEIALNKLKKSPLKGLVFST